MSFDLKKATAIAALALTVSAPMAMASAIGSTGTESALPVSVTPLGMDPQLPLASQSDYALNGLGNTVRIVPLGKDPQMPFDTQETTVRGAAVVTVASLSDSAAMKR